MKIRRPSALSIRLTATAVCCACICAIWAPWLTATPSSSGEVSRSAQQENETQEETVTPFEEEDLAREELFIIDREPFDRLYFDSNNGSRELDVEPIDLEGVDVTDPLDPANKTGRLVFTMKDYPGRKFATPWAALVKVERYADLVLAESEKAMSEGDYGTAFRTLAFLDAEPGFGRRAQISQMMDRCLYEDGEENLQNGQFGEALSAFEELYKRSPRYPVRGSGAVIDRITQCVDQFIEQKVNEGEYESARQILSRLQAEYGADVNEVVTR
ncbi:MAG: tetratricopeptide repeat protein, partial [Pirellulaceae bacterium]